ncbi:MAG: hypothetical protein ABSB78_02520 [Bacteroidota bacterium]
MNHLSNDELNELIDGRLTNSKKEQVLGHLQQCPLCSSAYRQFVIIDRGARRQPLETTNIMFVENVMRKLIPDASQKQHSRFERILKYCANLFALLIVAFMAYGVYSLGSHFIPGAKPIIPQIVGSSDLSTVRDAIGGWWSSSSALVQKYLTTLAPNGRLPLWVYGLWSIIMIVVIEKIAGKRIRHVSPLR